MFVFNVTGAWLCSSTDNVVDNLVSSGQLEECYRDKVRCALLQRHRHLNSRKDHHDHKILDHIRYANMLYSTALVE